MSRRRAFDTGLTNSNPAPKTASANTNASTTSQASAGQGQGKGKGKNSRGISGQVPPAITPPDPSVGSATVPTETSSEKAKALATIQAVPIENVNANADASANADQGEESELCFICAEPITFYSVGVCGHRTCHVCAVRLRTFYKKTECTFCKTPVPSLLFSRSSETPFPEDHHKRPSPPHVIAAAQENADKLPKGERWDRGLTLPGTLDLGAFPYTDEKLGVVFEDESMMEETLLLLRYNCPYDGCAHMGHDWPSLETHTLKTHGLVICTLCRKQLSRFAHEQVLYPPHLLCLHDPSRLARGQRAPRPKGEDAELVRGWEAPHPMCEFCHEAFFGPDELFKHMRERHEECFVCRSLGEKDVYFQNYNKLEQHFNAEHFPCHDRACLETKFVVFGSELDLKGHMVDVHGESMSARDRASMRHIAVDFAEAPSRRRGGTAPASASNGHGNSNGNGMSGGSTVPGGRGFTLSNTGPQQQQINHTPAMAPAQAAQARRAAQVDRQEESRRRRGFDTGLTADGQGQGLSQAAGTMMNGNRGGRSGFATPAEDVDDVTAGRHAALLSRLTLLVQGNENKLSSFRSSVRQYKNNESSAKDMIDTIYNILDRDVESTVGVLREVAGLFEDDEKRRNVLEAVNGFRIEQRDQFPALASAPTGLGSNYAGITSGAILNAKRSTQSHRRGSSSQNVWDRVEAAAANQPVHRPAATSGVNGRVVPGAAAFGFASGSRAGLNASAFPSLGSNGPGGSVRNTGGAGGSGHSTPWAGGGGGGGGSRTPSALTGVVRGSSSATTGSNAFPSIGQSVPAQPQRNTASVSSSLSRPAKPPSSSAFPALPAQTAAQQAREERRALFAKPTPREESIRRITGQGPAPVPAGGSQGGWGVKSPVEEMNGLSLGENEQGSGQAGGSGAGAGGSGGGGAGKKKGKGKQLLFQVSARPT